MNGRMRTRLVAVSVVTFGVVGMVLVWAQMNRDRFAADAESCASLPPVAVGTLRLFLPTGWDVQAAAMQTARERTRESDGAPVAYVAAWIVDETGIRATHEPALYVWEGGAAAEHEALPKSYYLLNDAAAHVTWDAAEQGPRADIRRAMRDARSLPQPYSEDDPAARAAAGCLP